MVKSMWLRAFLIAALAPVALGAANAHAQAKSDKGKIICWKDSSGKVVGCGDRVPPEYQASGTKELDKSGTTRKTTESAADIAKRQAQEKDVAADKGGAEEKRRLAEQKRQDSVLLNSYTTGAEIDRRRDRDLEPINQQIAQFQALLKAAPAGDKAKYEQGIASKEKDKEEIIQKYAAQKQRFLELKGEAPAAAKPAPATAAAPAPSPAPAKK